MKCSTPRGFSQPGGIERLSHPEAPRLSFAPWTLYTPPAMGPEKIRAIIYDFDDTIVESERINDALFSDLLRNDYSLDLSPEELDVLYGFSWSGVFDWLARNRGFRRSMKEVWVTFLRKKRDYLQGSRLRVARGFNRMLSLPVRQAIVSGSTRAEIDVMMENIGMPADSVDLILSDEDCEKGKPDPEGYLRALDVLDAPAHEALVFEDSPAGMEAARRAGISVAFVAELASRNNAALADLRFADFEEAYPWVRARIETAASNFSLLALLIQVRAGKNLFRYVTLVDGNASEPVADVTGLLLLFPHHLIGLIQGHEVVRYEPRCQFHPLSSGHSLLLSLFDYTRFSRPGVSLTRGGFFATMARRGRMP